MGFIDCSCILFLHSQKQVHVFIIHSQGFIDCSSILFLHSQGFIDCSSILFLHSQKPMYASCSYIHRNPPSRKHSSTGVIWMCKASFTNNSCPLPGSNTVVSSQWIGWWCSHACSATADFPSSPSCRHLGVPSASSCMAINSNVVSHFFHFRPDDDWSIQLKPGR